MSVAIKERKQVISLAETVGLFVVFAVILAALYPKDMIREQILTERKNYDLTAAYLQNMLNLEPENAELMLALAEVSVSQGKVDLGLKLLEVLRKNGSHGMEAKTYPLEYAIVTQQYNYTENDAVKENYMKQRYALLGTIALEGFYDHNETKKWYYEAVAVGHKRAAMQFLLPLLDEPGSERLQWLEQCFYLASSLQMTQRQKACLAQLQLLDIDRKEQWLKEGYYLSTALKERKQAQQTLEALAELSAEWKIELARFFVQTQQFAKASTLYMKFYASADTAALKEAYFLQALAALEAGALYDEAVRLAKAYEDTFLSSKTVTNRLIKLYLGANRLEDARRLSIKLLQRRGR